MGTKVDKLGRPKNLEDWDDPDVVSQDHVVASNAWGNTLYQQKSTRDRNVDLTEAMTMVSMLLKQYECQYRSHQEDDTLLHFPHLFQKPPKGAKIRNKTTNEVYKVQEALINPFTKQWEGLVKIQATDNAPDRKLLHKLEFLDENRYVRFTSEDPERLETESQDAEGDLMDKGPVRPTVVHALIRRLPGSISDRPFGPEKQYRPTLRETLRPDDDPNHTIEMYGQWFDQLVQFDCWTTDNFSADRLADWFERFVCLYGRVLKMNGVHEVLYWERLRDASVTKWRQDLKSRAVQYFIRTESLEAVVVRDITDIDYTIDLSNKIEKTVVPYEVAGQTITGYINATQYHELFRDSNGLYLFGDINVNDQNLT